MLAHLVCMFRLVLYLVDDFAWRRVVCKTAEEELRQLKGEVREKGQVVHDIRSETL